MNADTTQTDQGQVTVQTEKSEEVKEVEEKTEEAKAEPEKTPAEKKFELKKKSAQDRINDLTREKYTLKRELEQEKSKNKHFDGQPVPPDLRKFTDEYGTIDTAAYNNALGDYTKNMLSWHKGQEAVVKAEDEAKAEMETKIQNFLEQVDELEEEYPDIRKAIEKPIFGNELRNVLFDSELGAKIALFLSNNEKEAIRLNQLSEKQMVKEVGKLEERINNLLKNTSKAPAPLTPVDDSKGKMLKDIDEISQDQEWFNARRREKLERLKKRGK